MKNLFRIVNAVVLFSLLAYSAGFMSTLPASADAPRVCIPTCSEVDGRMLTVASVGYITLAGQTISVEIAVPGSLTTFSFGIFDGDTGGLWDNGTVPLVYSLYANPNLTDDASAQVAQWTGAGMANNAWTDVIVDQDPLALAPSGDYFYLLQIALPNAGTVNTVSNFKLRSNSPIELATNASFAYVIPMNSMAEANILYPEGLPTTTNPNPKTTYDGTWDLYLNIPTSSPNFSIWDGDTDYGSYDCTVADTNDPDTPDDVLPSWVAGISEFLEGAATTTLRCMDSNYNFITGPDERLYTSGDPSEDSWFLPALRSPSVTYDVIDPNGVLYHNGNPSGNQEWEQFRIDSNPNTLADYHVAGLMPAGVYHIHMTGLDMHNLNAWHLVSGKVVCVYEDGTPCVPVLHHYLIGDTIWYDENGNGIQDNGELGIPGVSVTALDANGQPIPGGTTVTNATGQFTFGVEAGTYSVQVDASNFGGALAGMASTTGGELQTNTVTTDNVLIYDFGYRGTASVGNFVWNDLNSNGIQSTSFEPAVPGVTVQLLGSDGATVLASTITDANGYYSFANLNAGTYYVQFSLAGYTFTTKNAPGSTVANDSNVNIPTGITDAITLVAGQTDNTIDGGLKPAQNMCKYVVSPGFWKNYSLHMTASKFQAILNATLNYSGTTPAQAVKILSTNNPSFPKFLLAAQLNAAWNGNINYPGVGGTFGTGLYYYGNSPLNGMTVNQILAKAYLHKSNPSQAEITAITYLGYGGELATASTCLVSPANTLLK